MNLILFDSSELQGDVCLLPPDDPRVDHMRRTLRLQVGDTFHAGLIDGPRGRGSVEAVDVEGWTRNWGGKEVFSPTTWRLSFVWSETPPPLANLTLIVGLPRPQTSRKLLREITALGVAAMHFVHTDLGEPGYARSPLWTTDEWRRHLIDGAQQAFDTHLPAVTVGRSLKETLASLPEGGTWLALDNYDASHPLSAARVAEPVVLALGPERGWSDAERELLRAGWFEMVHLGPRVLRVETACVAAVALVRSRAGLM